MNYLRRIIDRARRSVHDAEVCMTLKAANHWQRCLYPHTSPLLPRVWWAEPPLVTSHASALFLFKSMCMKLLRKDEGLFTSLLSPLGDFSVEQHAKPCRRWVDHTRHYTYDTYSGVLYITAVRQQRELRNLLIHYQVVLNEITNILCQLQLNSSQIVIWYWYDEVGQIIISTCHIIQSILALSFCLLLLHISI